MIAELDWCVFWSIWHTFFCEPTNVSINIISAVGLCSNTARAWECVMGLGGPCRRPWGPGPPPDPAALVPLGSISACCETLNTVIHVLCSAFRFPDLVQVDSGLMGVSHTLGFCLFGSVIVALTFL